jgi:hypothetical protein
MEIPSSVTWPKVQQRQEMQHSPASRAESALQCYANQQHSQLCCQQGNKHSAPTYPHNLHPSGALPGMACGQSCPPGPAPPRASLPPSPQSGWPGRRPRKWGSLQSLRCSLLGRGCGPQSCSTAGHASKEQVLAGQAIRPVSLQVWPGHKGKRQNQAVVLCWCWSGGGPGEEAVTCSPALSAAAQNPCSYCGGSSSSSSGGGSSSSGNGSSRSRC